MSLRPTRRCVSARQTLALSLDKALVARLRSLCAIGGTPISHLVEDLLTHALSSATAPVGAKP